MSDFASRHRNWVHQGAFEMGVAPAFAFTIHSNTMPSLPSAGEPFRGRDLCLQSSPFRGRSLARSFHAERNMSRGWGNKNCWRGCGIRSGERFFRGLNLSVTRISAISAISRQSKASLHVGLAKVAMARATSTSTAVSTCSSATSTKPAAASTSSATVTTSDC